MAAVTIVFSIVAKARQRNRYLIRFSQCASLRPAGYCQTRSLLSTFILARLDPQVAEPDRSSERPLSYPRGQALYRERGGGDIHAVSEQTCEYK